MSQCWSSGALASPVLLKQRRWLDQSKPCDGEFDLGQGSSQALHSQLQQMREVPNTMMSKSLASPQINLQAWSFSHS